MRRGCLGIEKISGQSMCGVRKFEKRGPIDSIVGNIDESSEGHLECGEKEVNSGAKYRAISFQIQLKQ